MSSVRISKRRQRGEVLPGQLGNAAEGFSSGGSDAYLCQTELGNSVHEERVELDVELGCTVELVECAVEEEIHGRTNRASSSPWEN